MKKFGTLFMLSCLTLQVASSTVYAQGNSTQNSATESTTDNGSTGEATNKDFALNKAIQLTGVPSNKEVLVDANGQLKLTTLKLPEGIKNNKKAKAVFKTSDKAVFSIDKDGNWKAVKEGKVTIEFGYQLDAETKKALEDAGYKIIDTLNKIELTITKKKTEETSKVKSDGMSIELKDVKGTNKEATKVLVQGQTYDLNPKVEGKTEKDISKFVYDADESFLKISYEKGKWQAVAKQSGVTTIRYGYILKEATGSEESTSSTEENGSPSTESTSSTTEGSSSTNSTSSTTEGSSSTESTSSTTEGSTSTESTSSTTEGSTSTEDPTSTTSSSSEAPNAADKKVRMIKAATEESTEESGSKLSDADKENMATMAVAIQESADKTFFTNYGMTISPIQPINVGGTGTLIDRIKMELPEKVEFNGTYVFNAPAAMLTINNQGVYTALRAGTVKVSYGYLLAPEMLKALANDEKFNLMDLASKDKFVDIVVKDKEGTDPMKNRPILHKGMSILLPDTITVGEEYTFKIIKDAKANIDGEFKIDYDKELFDITLKGDEGTLVAKKTGKISFNYGYIPSEKMYQKLMEENGGKALANDPGTRTLDVQAVQKPAPLQKTDTGKKYPQTGEARNNWLLISGVAVIAAAGGMVWFQSKKKKTTK